MINKVIIHLLASSTIVFSIVHFFSRSNFKDVTKIVDISSLITLFFVYRRYLKTQRTYEMWTIVFVFYMRLVIYIYNYYNLNTYFNIILFIPFLIILIYNIIVLVKSSTN